MPELKAKGHNPLEIGRILATAERKLNKLLCAMKIHQDLTNEHLQAVETFFRNYGSDNRLIELMKKKNRASALPEKSDMEILAQALTLPNLFFVTTDDHFGVLLQELEQQFGFVLVHDDNALQKLGAWHWN
ncbi:MAG: hypothetical protein V1676_07240 [Candidatus Diapherotrites archaeon]